MLAVVAKFVTLALLAANVAAAAGAHHARAGHHAGVVRRHGNALSPLLANGVHRRQEAAPVRVNRASCRPKTSSSAAPSSTSTSTTSTSVAPTTSSTVEVPTTTSTPPPPPPPTSTYVPPPPPTTTWTPDPTPTPAPQPPSNMHTGEATFYDCGLGACGSTDNENSYIVAVSHAMFDSYPGWDGVNPNNNPICGKKIRAWFKGHNIVVTVQDRCEACAHDDLDFCRVPFGDLSGGKIDGRGEITWEWL